MANTPPVSLAKLAEILFEKIVVKRDIDNAEKLSKEVRSSIKSTLLKATRVENTITTLVTLIQKVTSEKTGGKTISAMTKQRLLQVLRWSNASSGIGRSPMGKLICKKSKGLAR